MNSEEWFKETKRRANLIARHFTAEEMQIIDDFIQTARRENPGLPEQTKTKGAQVVHR